MAIHVFIDNSNIWGGAQRKATELEPHVPVQAVRVYFRNFFELIEGGRAPIGTRMFAGSLPPGNEDLWDYARKAGYDTSLLKRVAADDGRLVEQGVDNLLHLKILEAIHDGTEGETLVLATGDGRDESGSSFLGQVERALKKKWRVEVWSWAAQLSGAYRKMRDTAVKAGQVMEVKELDPYFHALTFIKEGKHEFEAGSITLAGRPVSKLIISP